MAKKLTGVNPPRRRKCLIVTDSLTPAKGSYSSLGLPLSPACVRTCISESAGKPQSVVRHFRDVIRSVILSLQSVISEYSKRFVRTHVCVSTVSSPLVVYTPVSPSVTYAH